MSRGWGNVHEKVERVRIGFPEKDFTAYLLRKGVLFILYVRTKSIITLLIFKTKTVRIQSFKCWHYYARAIQGKLEPLHFIVFIDFSLFLSWLELSEKENTNKKIQKIHLIFLKKRAVVYKNYFGVLSMHPPYIIMVTSISLYI